MGYLYLIYFTSTHLVVSRTDDLCILLRRGGCMRSTECSLVLAFSSLCLRVRYVSQIAGRYVRLVHKPTRDSVTRDK